MKAPSTGTPLEAAVEILARLVSFDTSSSKSNADLIFYVRDYLALRGIDVSLTWDDAKRKSNLLATIGPTDKPGLVLSAHTDVVPVTGQSWTSDPFTLTRRGDRLFGRGAVDMKGFIACALALVEHFRSRADHVPVHLALSYDEEIGCFGAPGLLDDLLNRAALSLMAVVGEPSTMNVINAHKGVRLFDTTITGRDCHSSDPRQGANAATALARLALELESLGEECVVRSADCPSAPLFDPGWSTVNVGILQSGTARNIVARQACVGWELRLLPDDDPDFVPNRVERFISKEILPRMRRTAPESSSETVEASYVPGLKPEPGGLSERICLAALGQTQTYAVPYGSDAGIVQATGISTVICGPGNIAQAHKPDEFITLDQMSACLSFLPKAQALLESA